MAVVSAQAEQKNVVINPAVNTVFFEGQSLTFNYKTGQWTRLSSVSGRRFFAVQDRSRVLGTIEPSGQSVMVQDSSISASAATATVTTGELELNVNGRAVVDSVRPITDGGSLSSVRIGVRDIPSDAVSWATGTAVNSRTGQSNFRAGSNPAEGRYHRAEFIFTGGFTTLAGADFDFYPQGKL